MKQANQKLANEYRSYGKDDVSSSRNRWTLKQAEQPNLLKDNDNICKVGYNIFKKNVSILIYISIHAKKIIFFYPAVQQPN